MCAIVVELHCLLTICCEFVSESCLVSKPFLREHESFTVKSKRTLRMEFIHMCTTECSTRMSEVCSESKKMIIDNL